MAIESGRATEPTSGASHGVIVREVWSPSDMETIFQIRDAVFVDEQQLTDDARHDPDDPESIHYLAWQEGVPIGTGRLTMFGREAQVAWVAVRADRRGGGVGKTLMRAMIERARQEGGEYVLLNAQTHAVGFYEDLGFRLVGSEFSMGGIGHYVMVLRFAG